MTIRERNQVASDGAELSGAAGRYAAALYELASDSRAAEQVAKALAAFGRLIEGSADLQRLVKSPVFSAQEQIRALDPILARAKISGVAANFIRFVASKRRLFALPAMISAYQRRHDEAKGVVRAAVTVAAPLARRHERALQQALTSVTGGKTVEMNVEVDPSIIGGLKVKLGSRMVDASLKTKLNSIRTRMKEVG